MLIGLLLIEGAVAGGSAAIGAGQIRAEQAPPGWERQSSSARYMNPATLGDLGVTAQAWMLDRYAVLHRPAPARALSLRATLGDGGQLRLSPAGGPEGTGPALLLEEGQPPRGVLLRPGAAPQALECEGSPSTTGPGPVEIRVEVAAERLLAEIGGERLECRAPASPGGPVLQAGLRRVHLDRMAVDGEPVPPPAGTGRLLSGAGLGALLAGILALVQVRGLKLRPGALALAWLPLLLCGLLAGWDAAPLHEALRLPDLPLRRIPLIFGMGPALVLNIGLLAVPIAQGRFSRRLERALAGALALVAGAAVAVAPGGFVVGVGLCAGLLAVPPFAARLLARRRHPGLQPAAIIGTVALLAAAGALLATLAGTTHPVARLYAALCGAALGGIAWATVNALRIRFYNLACLVLALAALGSLEWSLRFTEIGAFWRGSGGVQAAGTTASLVQEFEALEKQQFRDWPAEGYPVAVPPKRAPLRLVALGGSSTAGAYQNTRLDEFYPARLQERLGSQVEVVNQGVGGWNTLHISRFARASLPRLEPDVITLYIGVNEVVGVPMSYRELHAAWQKGRLRADPSWLDSLRLFHGLRFLARALRGSQPGVPPEHTRENLLVLVEAARAEGARLLLLSEAVQPRPEALDPYWAVMRELARGQPDIAFLHTAEAMQPLGPTAFLDENHLSDRGHRALAALIADELRRLGWVSPPTAAASTAAPE